MAMHIAFVGEPVPPQSHAVQGGVGALPSRGPLTTRMVLAFQETSEGTLKG
jgi:hypothetical protein